MSEEYISDLKEIRQIMQSRTRFLSLSGMSGILSGIYALIGAYIAINWAHHSERIVYNDLQELWLTPLVIKFIVLALTILILSLLTSFYFTKRKANMKGEALWTKASSSALIRFLVPLVIGGVFILALLKRGDLDMIAAACLIFYGLALYSASHFTFRDIATLGFIQMFLGILSLFLPGNGLIFWALGFGVMHIVYGTIMYFKYDRLNV